MKCRKMELKIFIAGAKHVAEVYASESVAGEKMDLLKAMSVYFGN